MPKAYLPPTVWSLLRLFLFLIATTPTAQAQSGRQAVTLSVSNAPLVSVLQSVRTQTGYVFFYEEKDVKDIRVSAQLRNTPLDQALQTCLKGTSLDYKIIDRNVVISRRAESVKDKVLRALTPSRKVTGTARDEAGAPAPGVVVAAKGSSTGTITDDQGHFSVSDVDDDAVLGFRGIAYDYQEVRVGDRSVVNVSLKTKTNQLSGVTVSVNTGYQTLAKERATGAFGSISARELEKVPTPNVLQRLEGQVPGVQVSVQAGDNTFTYGNTQLGIQSGTRTVGRNDYNINIRGVSTYSAEASPLLVVDGAITDLDIKTFNPRDIENITFLKDAAAASIWGTRAANGVIVITTKKGRTDQAPKLSFSTDLTTSAAPRLDYLRLMTAAQMINYEEELVRKNLIVNPLTTTTLAQPVARATELAFQLRAGQLTQAQYNEAIATLSARDNRSQIRDYLLQPATNQQYNLSLSGGNPTSTYFYSGSYSRELPNARGTSGQRLTLTLNNTFTVLKVATLSTSLKGAFFKYDRGSNYTSLPALYTPSATTLMPYDLLVDEAGNSLSYARTYYGPYTDRLQAQGYLPWRLNYLNERDNASNVQKENNYVATVNLQVPLFRGLSASALYTTEQSAGTNRLFYNESTYYNRNLLNSATTVGTTGRLVYGLPTGGILSQTSTTLNNYSLRGQLTYDRTFGEHQLNAIAGTEIRETNVGQGSGTLYGYNDQTGIAQPVNFATPYPVLEGYQLTAAGAPAQADKQRRFLSYYANASYDFKERYVLSGSVRYDDYNNFGVDRSFRATPLWSSGLKWNIGQETFMKAAAWVNSLGLRATYGVNGNIATDQYPFTYIGLSGSDPQTTHTPTLLIRPTPNCAGRKPMC